MKPPIKRKLTATPKTQPNQTQTPNSSDQVGRLAFRVEGLYWKAYYATMDDMENAILIGQIVFNPIKDNEDLKIAFMQLMRETLTIIFSTVDVTVAGWQEPVLAPDHERKP